MTKRAGCWLATAEAQPLRPHVVAVREAGLQHVVDSRRDGCASERLKARTDVRGHQVRRPSRLATTAI